MKAFAKCIGLFFFVFNSLITFGQQTFRTTATGSVIGYLEYLPQDYNSNSNKYPVVIFLHGMDERGSNSTDPATLQTTISLVTKLGPPMQVKNGAQFPFILISPQLKSAYGNWPSSYVQEVVDYVKTYLRIDERRIHVTGLSLGGYGAWTCIEDLPKLFASGAPVCGGYNNKSKACGIASENVSVWAFHGDADPVVSYTMTTNMVNAINACSPAPNPKAIATIYAGIAHNAWYRAYFIDNTYHNPNLYQWWMLQTKLKQAANTIPLANAGGDKSINGSSVSISGSGSDANGSISSYKWAQLQGPSKATLTNATSATVTVSGLASGKYVFKLQVTDNGGATDTDYVTVNVTSGGNAPPVANAGDDKTVTLPTTSTSLTGSGSDVDGTISSYAWTKVSGGAATLGGTSTTTLSVSGLVAGTYVFRLTVKDNAGATNSDDVTLNVVSGGNSTPVAHAGADKTITLPTNSTTFSGSGTDSDGTIASYTWTKVSGGAATLSGTTTATLSVSGLVAGSYVFRLAVKDNAGATGTDDVALNVVSGTNAAPVADAGVDKLINLPTNTVTIAGKGTDSNGSISSYAWSKLSGGSATLSGATTSTLAASSLVAGTYVFRLLVTDNGGSTDTDDVTVIVNNPPVVSVGADVKLTLPTNSLSVQGTCSDTDGSITSYSWKMTTGTVATLSGITTSKLTATGLIAGKYVFRLFATDNKGATKFDDIMVTVSGNTAPVVSVGNDFNITLPTNSLTVQGVASDADGTISSYQWKMTTGTVGTLSNINTSKLTATNLVEGKYVFRLIVTDNNGASSFDDVMVYVLKKTSTASVDSEVQLVQIETSPESEAILNWGNDEYWRDKKVLLYDGDGKQIFNGTWKMEDYDRLIHPGTLYIYNIVNTKHKVKTGKFVRTNL